MEIEDVVKNALGDFELYPPQEEAIKRGILKKRRNFIISSPTASGKTLIAELIMLSSVMKGGKSVYLAPLNALAYEKYMDFERKYSKIAKIKISTGNYDNPSLFLEDSDIIILTFEKFDSLTRLRPRWLEKISTMVIDEIHVIGDEKRGPRLEGAVARFRSINPDCKILGLSATISNSDEFAEWLDGELVKSEWRPVPLKEKIFVGNDEKLIKYILKTVSRGDQILVFINTKKGSVSFCRKLAEEMKKRGILASMEDKHHEELQKLADIVDIGVDDLADFVRTGVAYHNSWLHPEQRNVIEEGFRRRLIRVICCTPTLSLGVSLPTKVAIVRNYKFFHGYGSVPMPVFWVKQVFGRAGRPEHDDIGIGMIVARSKEEKKEIEDMYIGKETERITSHFSEDLLEEQILATIVSGARRKEEIVRFIKNTLFFYQMFDHSHSASSSSDSFVDDVLISLENDGFVELSSEIKATDFGVLTSRLYLSLNSALNLRDGITFLSSCPSLSEFDLLVLLCRCDEVSLMKVKNAEEVAMAFTENMDWIFDYYSMRALGAAIVSNAWINEMSYKEIKERFGVYPGEVYGNIYTLEWISYAASRVAEYLNCEKICSALRMLNRRIKHGVREDLLGLVCINGVGRTIARRLYSAGFRNYLEVASADVDELARIKGIGEKFAHKIKDEARKIMEK